MSNLIVANVNGQDAQAGKAKAWANLNGTGPVALRDSFNVSSLVDMGTGSYQANFTNVLTNDNHPVQVSTRNTASVTVPLYGETSHATLMSGLCTKLTGDLYDPHYMMLTTHGELA